MPSGPGPGQSWYPPNPSSLIPSSSSQSGSGGRLRGELGEERAFSALRPPLAATHTPPASDTNPGHRGSQPSTLASKKPEQAGCSFLEEAPMHLRRKIVLRGLRWENCCQKKKKPLTKKSSTDRNLKPRESWDIKQGRSWPGPSFRRQRSQNCEANRWQRKRPRTMLPACAGQEGGARGSRRKNDSLL